MHRKRWKAERMLPGILECLEEVLPFVHGNADGIVDHLTPLWGNKNFLEQRSLYSTLQGLTACTSLWKFVVNIKHEFNVTMYLHYVYNATVHQCHSLQGVKGQLPHEIFKSYIHHVLSDGGTLCRQCLNCPRAWK